MNKLSENFTLKELTVSQFAVRNAVKEQFTPNKDVITNLTNLCNKVLEPIRAALGCPIRVSSGYRCYYVNRMIGGAATSQHVSGQAVDINNTKGSDIDIAKVVVQHKIEFDQMIVEFGTLENPSWIHISYNSVRNRKQILRASKVNGKTKYTPLTEKEILDI